ncbi:MAG: hypothetical protein ABIN00_08120 [candidate division WOR-3 bacterium]
MEREQEIKIEEISKEQFLNFLDYQQKRWEDILMQAQTRLFELARIERQMEKLEERGYLLTFFSDGENCFYEASLKPPIGFTDNRKEGEK